MKPTSTQNGTNIGYMVEARAKNIPVKFQGTLLDKEWRQVSFVSAPPGFGVPARYGMDHANAMFGLYSYEAAQALRWWALANDILARYQIETRLMRYRAEYKAECFQEGPAGDDGDTLAFAVATEPTP